MSFIHHQHASDKTSKQQAIAELFANTTYDRDFYVLLIGAILLAVSAIFIDSIPVLIASMIVAPLAYPILALGMGIAVNDWRLVGKSFGMLLLSCGIALVITTLATLWFGGEHVANKFIAFNGNREIAFIVAIVAGGIAAYGLIRPRVASAITGVAIAVSLMPPLVATGIGFASGDVTLGYDAAVLFGLNVVGILIASVVTFLLLKMGAEYRKSRVTHQDNHQD